MLMSKVYYTTVVGDHDDGGSVEADTAADAARSYLTEFLYYEGLSLLDMEGRCIEVEDETTDEVSIFEVLDGDLELTEVL